MAQSVTVRRAEVRDLTGIHAIYAHAVTHGTASFELEPPPLAEMHKRFAAIVDGGFPYLVAEGEGRVLGYAYANAYRPRPAYRFTVEDSIYIAHDAQRRGVGQALLVELLRVSEAAGYRQMIAVIGDSAQHASIGLHRRHGFTFSGTVHAVGYKHGRWLDSVLMQRPLGAGDTTAP
jgi:L-amino acid N-acyltransferase YncA